MLWKWPCLTLTLTSISNQNSDIWYFPTFILFYSFTLWVHLLMLCLLLPQLTKYAFSWFTDTDRHDHFPIWIIYADSLCVQFIFWRWTHIHYFIFMSKVIFLYSFHFIVTQNKWDSHITLTLFISKTNNIG